MSHTSSLEPRWDTASMGLPADISSNERTALSEHLSLCGALRSPVQAAWGTVSGVVGWMSERTVTAALLIIVLASATWLVF
mgnify:CR=1 FL=1